MSRPTIMALALGVVLPLCAFFAVRGAHGDASNLAAVPLVALSALLTVALLSGEPDHAQKQASVRAFAAALIVTCVALGIGRAVM